MNILELLQSQHMAWVGGHHTRIVSSDDGIFRVLRKKYINDSDSPYVIVVYEGSIETVAVAAFLDCESE